MIVAAAATAAAAAVASLFFLVDSSIVFESNRVKRVPARSAEIRAGRGVR